MKTILLTFILSIVWLNLSSSVSIATKHIEWANDVDKTIREIKNVLTVGSIESGFNAKAWNAYEDAAGILQIRQVMLREVNRIMGKEVYTDSCRFNPRKSIEMFLIVQRYYNPSANFKTACKVWNAGNPACADSTIKNYWAKASKTMRKLF